MSETIEKQESTKKEALGSPVRQIFPIAGIGASAGGLEAIKKLLESLPQDTGLAFVIVQHLATNQESMLPEILSRSTQMPVNKIEDGMVVEPNQVYVIPAGKIITVRNGLFKLQPKGISLKPIDEFLCSLALERKTHAIGIILSGTGSDGTEGLRAVKTEGGITFAQDLKSAQYPDMPKSAIAAEVVDFVRSPEQIAEELCSIARHPEITRQKIELEEPKPQEAEDNLQTIFNLLRASFGVNFANYKKTTINRRISRRMILNNIENIKKYVAYLRMHREEQQALFNDMLISVTDFFREPNTFLALKEKVFPELVEKGQFNLTIRVWIPGCSTGEEVYSIAMALTEFIEEKGLTFPILIFGTDVNGKNIEKARRGIYLKSIENTVSQDRLKRFFTCSNGNYQVIKQLRDKCVFAKHDILQDPPFSNMDLIVCRNLLIYLEVTPQERVLATLNYALKPGGYLVLGESESVGKFTDSFEPLTKRGVIFKKKTGQPKVELPMQMSNLFSKEMGVLKLPKKADSQAALKEEVDQLLLTQFAPATLLVNNDSDILAIRGQVNPYVAIEPGTPSFNVTKLLRKDLRPTVQTALYRAKKVGKDVKEIVHLEYDGGEKTVNLHVKPIKLSNYEEPFFLILFEEKEKAAVELQTTKTTSSSDRLTKAKDQQIKELSEDLESTKQTLQTVIEQQEAINEELRSANEEIQSSNEELMSTNEELETSKEELQSANEELTTLNDELKQRNQMLKELNEDLANLMNNVDTAVIIVDRDFKIKRFTASAQELLRLTPEDLGHSIVGIRLGIPAEDLEKPLSTVIARNEVVRTEIKAGKDRWYQMRIRPYVTEEKKIGGAVLSFADVSEIKTLAHQVKEQADKLVQSEILATVGRTAGMVGHDIRNPLQAIVSDIYLAKTELASTPESDEKKNLLESLQGIEENTEYINKIVADLQDYARTAVPRKEKVNVVKVVQEVLSYVTIPKDVAVSYSVSNDFPVLNLDALYLKRILTNLISNAVQAMQKEGKLSVDAFCQDDRAVIIIADTGVGISNEIKDKIFTPLFTTKAKGQGFGLPVVKRLTEAMGGTVTFESEKGSGSKFILKFPIPCER